MRALGLLALQILNDILVVLSLSLHKAKDLFSAVVGVRNRTYGLLGGFTVWTGNECYSSISGSYMLDHPKPKVLSFNPQPLDLKLHGPEELKHHNLKF